MQQNEFIKEIPLNIIRALLDKSTSVRQSGAKELASFICQKVDLRYDEEITNFLRIFNDQFPDKTSILSRRAILMGYGVISSVKKSQEKETTGNMNENKWLKMIIDPLLASFKDSDTKLICDSANSLIKIIKSHNYTVNKYFNEFFEGLFILTVNPDQEVRNIANSMDEVLKTIINKSINLLVQNSDNDNSNLYHEHTNQEKVDNIQSSELKIDDLIQKLLDKIRANHPAIRILVVSWIKFLDSIQQIKLINRISDFLPGLFNMLCDKTKDVNQTADQCLKHFLLEIEKVFENCDKETLNKIIEIIVQQCKSEQDAAKLIAFDWLLKFLNKYNTLLNTFVEKNIKYHHKYYKKLGNVNNIKERISVLGVKKSINFMDNKKIFMQSFNEGLSSPFLRHQEKLLNSDENKKVSFFQKNISECSLENKSNSNNLEKINFEMNKSYEENIKIRPNNSDNHLIYKDEDCNSNMNKNNFYHTANEEKFDYMARLQDEKRTIKKENDEEEIDFKLKSRSNHSNSVYSNMNNYSNKIFQIYSKIPFYLFPKILDAIFFNLNSSNNVSEKSNQCNEILYNMIELFTESKDLNIKNFETVIRNYFDSKTSIDKILKWIQKLFEKFGDEMFSNLESFIEKFTTLLTDSDEKIFDTVLDILCKISNSNENYTESILCKILEKLCINRNLLNGKGLFILTKLCSLIPVTKVYTKIADVLLKFEDIEFISSMINILDIFLLSYKETEELRNLLKKLRIKNNSHNVKDFFSKLYTTWCFNPISLLILCIISEHFQLSYNLILEFPKIKLDEEYVIQLSKLVQLIESSLFNDIRVLMLEPGKNIFLIKTLYGILMLLPQGKAYNALSKRLKSVEMLIQLDNVLIGQENNISPKEDKEEIRMYLDIFNATQILVLGKKEKIKFSNFS